jgi:hypothetical protein
MKEVKYLISKLHFRNARDSKFHHNLPSKCVRSSIYTLTIKDLAVIGVWSQRKRTLCLYDII